MESTGLDLQAWLERVKRGIDPRRRTNGPTRRASGPPIKRDGNPEGALYGEVVVFTGALEMPRREAADLAARVGCTVAAGVTKKTSLLVVGDQDVRRLAGEAKSSKHRKAERLIAKGHEIRIMGESDFKELVRHAEENA